MLPPFEHWISVEGAAVIASAVLAVVAIDFMATSRKHLILLIGAGCAASFLGTWVLAEKSYRASNYCYFSARLDLPQPGGGYEWQLVNHQQRVIQPVKYCFYRKIDGKRRFTHCWPDTANMCLTDAINQTTAGEAPITPGTYFFKFQAKNSWEQSLEIKETVAKVEQTGVIYRAGEEIDRFHKEIWRTSIESGQASKP